MTKEDKLKILDLSKAGFGYIKISNMLELPVNTVKTFLRRSKQESSGICLQCGRKTKWIKGKKKKKFCSDECRMAWWNAHRESGNKKAFYKTTCLFCGKEFTAYSTSKRKYCSRGCFAVARRK